MRLCTCMHSTVRARGQVSSWSDLVNSFAESCALCNKMLLCKQVTLTLTLALALTLTPTLT